MAIASSILALAVLGGALIYIWRSSKQRKKDMAKMLENMAKVSAEIAESRKRVEEIAKEVAQIVSNQTKILEG